MLGFRKSGHNCICKDCESPSWLVWLVELANLRVIHQILSLSLKVISHIDNKVTNNFCQNENLTTVLFL